MITTLTNVGCHMPGGRPRSDVRQRFLEKVEVKQTGCHEWQSVLHRDGYGKFYLDGKQIQAHRAAYLIFIGNIPKKAQVLHRCDNRKCVNLDHLYIGTPKDNTRDKIERCAWWGRMKFSAAEISECKRLYESGLSQVEIGRRLNMDQTTVSRFCRGKHLNRT